MTSTSSTPPATASASPPTPIRICGHAPLSLGAVLNTKPEDLLVYWRWLNDRGGIHGRRVEMSLEDDQYSASGGVPAAQRCAERNPFFLLRQPSART